MKSILLAAIFFLSGTAHAAYIAYLYESGGNVLGSGSGTLNITALGVQNTPNVSPQVRGNTALLAMGATTNELQMISISGPPSFGPGGAFVVGSGSGDGVAIAGFASSVYVPAGYVSGAPLDSTAWFAGHSLATLGVTAGTYVWTWGVGATADSYTLNIGTPPPSQTIAFANPGPQRLGTNPALAATASSGLTPVFAAVTPAVCTVTPGGVLTFISVGNCTVNANQPGNGGFAPAPQVSRTFAVLAASAPASVPSLQTWALVLLSLIVGVLGLARRRNF